MNGFHIQLTSNIIGIKGDISVTPIGKAIADYQSVLANIKKHTFVKNVSPENRVLKNQKNSWFFVTTSALKTESLATRRSNPFLTARSQRPPPMC